MGVLHEPQRDGPPARAGILAGQVPESVPVGQDAHDRVQAAPEVGAEQFEGVVAAVVDDQVGGRQGLEMGERGGALVGVGVEVEVDRDPSTHSCACTRRAP